jgi:methyl-accepting chemotaxis protein
LGILVLKRSLFELGGFQTKLSQVVLQMSDVSNHMKTVSSQLSSNAHQSASSVQESVSALAEMSSMLTATASNTEETAQICVGVQEKGTQGLQIMEELCGAMDRLDQMSLKLKEILDIIDAVSVKTGVINEVVFKTQLLSVNASIEAARAGQYGKGFAVVAQEVSELASLSGKASGDIRQMLEDSKLKVAQIVRDTSQAIQQGSNVSSSSVSTFKDILGSVDAISRKVIEISHATREQELGVQQTMAAAEQLNVSTSDTNQAAHQSVQFAESLQERAQDLFGVSTQFKNLIGDGQFLKALENRRNSAGIWTAGDLDSLKKSLDFSKPLVGEKEEMVEWRKSA